jgi:fluoride exporter
MRNLFLVGTGGFLGSAARYLLSGLVTQASGAARFPLGTLVVNLLGCLAIGLLAGMAEHRHAFSAATRLFLFTGILGGFTTFSAFAFETYFLGREQAWGAGLANIGLQVVLGLAAVWVGHQVVSG